MEIDPSEFVFLLCSCIDDRSQCRALEAVTG
jgi:hypothetical protein